MRLAKLVRTSSFRLTLLYACLFSASVVVLFGVVYWATAFYMTAQLEAGIDSDITELMNGAQAGGPKTLAKLIEQRVNQMPRGPIVYLLEDPTGQVIVGNLPSIKPGQGTFNLDTPALRWPGGHLETIHARSVKLSNGDTLVVGADAYPLNEMREVILSTFGWGFAITILLAFGGGAFMSNRLLSRVETISRASRAIMDGELSQRIPLRGVDDEFDHLAASLNAMLDRSESSIEAIRQVSNDIAHDLRTPLTRLRQRLELARLKATSVEELRVAIDHSIVGTDAILETFGALLRIAQIESGRRTGQFATVALSELLHTLAEIYQPSADEKQQHLSVAIEAELFVWGDRELLAQMLANLIENAVRHAPNGAKIEIIGRTGPTGIEVIVADSGPGIPTAERGHVLRRFFRLEASRSTPGSGLGLALVAAIAGLHQIALDLADNQPGLRVTLHFPKA